MHILDAKRVFEKSAYSLKKWLIPPSPLIQGRKRLKKVPLSKGDLGGSELLKHALSLEQGA